jgi:hypothetical protein
VNLGAFSWELQSAVPLLGPLQLLPLLLAGLLLRLGNSRWSYRLALGGAALQIGLVMLLLYRFDPYMPALQFAEQRTLIPPLTYAVAADATAVALVATLSLATLVLIVVWGARGPAPDHRLLALLFALEGWTLALVLATHPAWFVAAFTAHLVLLGWWLAGRVDGGERNPARRRRVRVALAGLWLTAGALLGARHLADGAFSEALSARTQPTCSATSNACPGSALASLVRQAAAAPSSR